MEGKGIKPVPMVDYYMAICRHLGLVPPRSLKPRLFFSEAVRKKGEALFGGYGIGPAEMVIGINPGARFGASKCWPAEYFARLAELVSKKWDCRILLLVGPGEDEIAASILASTRAAVINTGPDRVDLALLKYVVSRLDFLITNDTGPRHYGVAFDIPTVVIMGPTNPDYTAANLERTAVLRKDLDCSPCHEKQCPPGHHQCMTLITPEEVLEESSRLLEKVGRQPR
jgi:heptosyltransferase-2